MKSRLKDAGVSTRGPDAPLFGTGSISDVFDSFKGESKEAKNDQQRDPALDPQRPTDFANEYKLNIAENLLPTNRGGQN